MARDLDDDQDMESNSPLSSVEGENPLAESSNHYQTEDAEYPRAETPQNDHLNASAPGELSPPRSQSQSQALEYLEGSEPVPTLSNGYGGYDGYESSRNGGRSGEHQAISTSEESLKPGAGWKNKRALEESERAHQNLTDRDEDLREFGDVMASADPSQFFSPKVFGNREGSAQQRGGHAEKR